MQFDTENFIRDIFSSKLNNFEELASQLFLYQRAGNPVLAQFCEDLGSDTEGKSGPVFLPVEFFKSHVVKTGNFVGERTFLSSITSGSDPSRHYIKDTRIYEQSFRAAFTHFYGDVREYCILALLPSYLERKGSSLTLMAEGLIRLSGNPLSGFYLADFQKLHDTLVELKAKKQKTILLGVSFALLDFAEQFSIGFPQLVVMETGGMKGRRKEMIREELHGILKTGFGTKNIHSEYGMTELLSQAYSSGNGIFNCPPWMKVLISDINDPFTFLPPGKTGLIHVIDLANLYSCAFIRTGDIGLAGNDGSFSVLGRSDSSDIRGCSLMYL